MAAHEKRLTRRRLVGIESCREIDDRKWRRWKISQLDVPVTAGVTALLVAVAITAWPGNSGAIRQAANFLPLNVTLTQPTTVTVWTGPTSGPPTTPIVTSRPPTQVTVPNVVGLQKDDAIAAMKAVGLLPGSIGSDNQCIEPQGTVATQTPGAGPFVLVPGATFHLTVSSGHDGTGKPCTFR